MSVAVSLADLSVVLADYPWGYLLTVADDGRPRVRAVPTQMVGTLLCCRTGEGARSNVTVRPTVSMVFPPAEDGGMSLIVDGDAVAVDDGIELTPTGAVLHRAAIRG